MARYNMRIKRERTTPSKDKWTMPKWMEPYRGSICNTGGNTIEECMNGNSDPVINLPLSTIQFGVKSQVALLYSLHNSRKLQ